MVCDHFIALGQFKTQLGLDLGEYKCPLIIRQGVARVFGGYELCGMQIDPCDRIERGGFAIGAGRCPAGFGVFQVFNRGGLY